MSQRHLDPWWGEILKTQNVESLTIRWWGMFWLQDELNLNLHNVEIVKDEESEKPQKHIEWKETDRLSWKSQHFRRGNYKKKWEFVLDHTIRNFSRCHKQDSLNDPQMGSSTQWRQSQEPTVPMSQWNQIRQYFTIHDKDHQISPRVRVKDE